MNLRTQGISDIWSSSKPLIGMIHLLPLPGSPRWGGAMAPVLERAATDARALAQAGFDGLLVENFLDAPFHPGRVPAETVASLTLAVARVQQETALPVGINVLRNDARAGLAVALATGAPFIRVNVHTGVMFADQGILEGRAHETLRDRRALDSSVAILADVHVKHAVPPPGSDPASAAADAWFRGLADALVVSGTATGQPADLEVLRSVRAAVPDAPVLVGSGVTPDNVRRVLSESAGAIIGSCLMWGGCAGAGIDPERAQALVRAARRG